ncbi:putative glycoside hydrolase, partial [bacterium]
LTGWSAGSRAYRKKLDKLLRETELNTLVIAVKEYNGEVYIPGVKKAVEFGAYTRAMPAISKYIQKLKEKGVYSVARIVLFKDDIAAKYNPEWAVKNKFGRVWEDNKKQSWLDPYNREAWNYNFSVADKCVELGFEEIQFDYIRFPSDGDIEQCQYSKPHSSTTAVAILLEFLKEARKRYTVNKGIPISIDVFGLTTSAKTDLGIGQILTEMAKYVDYVCPMVYPSHYNEGVYGIENPDADPYNIIRRAIYDARECLGSNSAKLRPYLQDFTLDFPYTEKEVLAQIQMCYDNDVPEWTLWNPKSRYTETVFKPEEYSDIYEKTRTVISSSTFVTELIEK